MKRFRPTFKLFVCALCLLFLQNSLSIPQTAHGEGRSSSLPFHGGNLHPVRISPYQAAFLLETSQSASYLSLLSPDGSCRQSSLPHPYSGLQMVDGKCFVYGFSVQADPDTDTLIKNLFTAELSVQTGQILSQSKVEGIQPAENCFLLLPSGYFLYTDKYHTNELRLCSGNGELIASKTLNSKILSFSVSPSGRKAVLSLSGGACILDLRQDVQNLLSSLTVISFPSSQSGVRYELIAEQYLSSDKGEVFHLTEGQKAEKILSGLSPQLRPFYDETSSSLLGMEEDGSLFFYSCQSQSKGYFIPKNETGCKEIFSLSSQVYALSLSNGSLFLTELQREEDEIPTVHNFSMDNQLSPSELQALWDEAQPHNGNSGTHIDDLFLAETNGTVSPIVLDDGKRMFNFFRAAAGLPQIRLEHAKAAQAAAKARFFQNKSMLSQLVSGAELSSAESLYDESITRTFSQGRQSNGRQPHGNQPFSRMISNIFSSGAPQEQQALLSFQESASMGLYQNGEQLLSSIGLTGKAFSSLPGAAWPAGGSFPSEVLSSLSQWSFRLNPSVLSFSDSSPVVTVASSKGSAVYTYENGLEREGQLLIFPAPSDRNRASFEVTVENLTDNQGMPASVSYRISSAKLTTSSEPAPSLTFSYRYVEDDSGVEYPVYSPTILSKGDTIQLLARETGSDELLSQVRFSSSNKASASVTPGGSLVCHGTGSFFITAEYENHTYQLSFYIRDESDPSNLLSSEIYTIDRQHNTVTGFPLKIVISKAIRGFSGNGVIRIVSAEGEPQDTGYVGTGMAIELLQEGKAVDRLIFLVPMDLNGDGKLTEKDCSLLKDQLLERVSLAPLAQSVSDVNQDGRVNSIDLYLMYRYKRTHGN